ncbi:hypothetical protein BGX23_011732 [Mortierella sp. AD031]|nr:hypothetical protein BGX23_011732 [Mortierella sp. AD031]
MTTLTASQQQQPSSLSTTASRSNTSSSVTTTTTATTASSIQTPGTPTAEVSSNTPSTTTTTRSSSGATGLPFSDRIRAAEHRFTALTQNITHFSPLKTQLDKHNQAIERLESDIKKKTALLQACQHKLKSISRRPQTSGQGSHVSLHASSSEDSEADAVAAQHRATKEALESLNGQLLAAKILHIGLTRQVTQYFESRGELQALLEEIFSGSTPEHPSEDALERELEQITADIAKVKMDFEKHRAATNEFKEIRRYVDIWNEAVEKQIATNPKDVSKPLKKLVPFFSGPKPPSYTKVADAHMTTARGLVPSLENIGFLSEIKMDTVNDTSNDLIIYTAKFKDGYNTLSNTLEVLHKKSRVLKKKKNQCIEKLFTERCRIFSVELQEYYRSIGESLAGGSGSIAGEEHHGDGSGGVLLSSSPGGGGAAGGLTSSRLVMHRQHVENLDAYSSEGSSLGGHHSQELLLEAEELPSYFQHQQQHNHTILHRRTGSLGSPAHSSSASSSISLNSPFPGVAGGAGTMLDSPPDYVRDEAVADMGGPSSYGVASSGAGEEEEDAMFRAYRLRYDTRQRQNSDPRSRPVTRAVTTTTTTTTALSTMDTPPGYDETRYHTVVDPV